MQKFNILVGILFFLPLHCQFIFGNPKPEEISTNEAPYDPKNDDGAKELETLKQHIATSTEFLQGRRFVDAQIHYSYAIDEIKEMSDIGKSHPDFSDLLDQSKYLEERINTTYQETEKIRQDHQKATQQVEIQGLASQIFELRKSKDSLPGDETFQHLDNLETQITNFRDKAINEQKTELSDKSTALLKRLFKIRKREKYHLELSQSISNYFNLGLEAKKAQKKQQAKIQFKNCVREIKSAKRNREYRSTWILKFKENQALEAQEYLEICQKKLKNLK